MKTQEELLKSLNKEDLDKIEAIEKARKILEDAQVPYWLFAERKCLRIHPNGVADEEPSDEYNMSNWCPTIKDENGNFTQAGMDFYANHSGGLYYSIYHIMRSVFSMLGVPNPEWNEILGLFSSEVIRYAKSKEGIWDDRYTTPREQI